MYFVGLKIFVILIQFLYERLKNWKNIPSWDQPRIPLYIQNPIRLSKAILYMQIPADLKKKDIPKFRATLTAFSVT